MEKQVNQNQTQQNNAETPKETTEVEVIFDSVEPIDAEKYYKKTIKIQLPAGKESKILKVLKELEENTDIIAEADADTKASIDITLESRNKTNKKDVGARDELGGLEVTPKVDDKELVMRNANIKRVSKSTAKLKLAQSLGVGNMVQVPLWHSGIWVTLKPMTKEDKVNLMLKLSEDFGRIGKETNGLVFSNSSVAFAGIVLDYIRDRIIATNVALPDGEDIFDYIKIQDMYPLITGFLKTMYPRGVNYIMQCRNTLEVVDGLPKCNYKANVKLDLSKLLWVDMDKLDVEHKTHMTKRGNKAVTLDEVKKYQETLEANQSETISITTEDNTNVTITISSPNLSKYLELGTMFISDLRDKANELIKDKKVIKEPEYAELLILNTIFLSQYNHYVDKVTVDGELLTSESDINDALEMLSNNTEYRKLIKEKITSYIDNSLVAIVGIPDWTCPECKSSQVQEGSGNFKSFIPLAVLEYFFTHLGVQYERLLEELAEN